MLALAKLLMPPWVVQTFPPRLAGRTDDFPLTTAVLLVPKWASLAAFHRLPMLMHRMISKRSMTSRVGFT